LQNGFDIVLGVLHKLGPLKFAAVVLGPDLSNGMFVCNFRLNGDMNECDWECCRTLSDLCKLRETIQKDRNLRGLGSSVPPLPEKKLVTNGKTLIAREMVTEFVRAMFTNVVFLGYPAVLNTFEVPCIVRTKVDTFAKLYQTPLLSSWLSKEGGKIKNWKKRWIVLYPDFTLRYYDSKNEVTGGGKGFRGMVDIQALERIKHHKIDATKKYIFVLILKYSWQEKEHPREYKFQTSESAVQSMWLRAVTLLRDGDLSKYIPEVTEFDAGTVRTLKAMGIYKSPSSILLEREKLSNVKLLAKLGEMRLEQDNFNARNKFEQEEFEREQQKFEDEYDDLRPKLLAAKEALGLGQENIQILKRKLKTETERCWKDMEEAENLVRQESLRYNLRTGLTPVPVINNMVKRKLTIIENTAPSVYGKKVDMYTSPVLLQTRDLWFVMIRRIPFLEWTDLSDNLDAPSATRMQIAKVSYGPVEDGECRSFTVHSLKKNKEITLVVHSAKECQMWVRMIKNGLGLLSDYSHEEKYDTTEDVDNTNIFALDIDSGDPSPRADNFKIRNSLKQNVKADELLYKGSDVRGTVGSDD